eukprot:6177913-Pleurochrysis_carterae.AAC.1
MSDNRGQRSLTLRTFVTVAGCRCSSRSSMFASTATSGRRSSLVGFTGSTIVGRPLEERSSDSDSDVPSGSSSSGCVAGGSGKSSSA